MLAAASASQAATMLSVGAESLCGGGACFSESKTTFKRTWSASEFRSPTAISALALDRSLLGEMQDHAVRVSFQDAEGNTIGSWGAFTVAVLSGEVVVLGGEALTWDASRGDLTLKLELVMPESGGVGGGGGFGGGGGGGGRPAFSAAPGPGGGPIMSPLPALEGSGRVAVLAVPEPGAWALMLMGFTGAGAMLRSRRSAPLKV